MASTPSAMSASGGKRAGWFRRGLGLVLAILLLIPPGATLAAADEGTAGETPQAAAPAPASGTYEEYLQKHAGIPAATTSVVVSAAENYTVENMPEAKIIPASEIDGAEGDSLLTAGDGSVTWTFTLPADAMYQIQVKYCPFEGLGGRIERKLLIDGLLPYDEAEYINFDRTFYDIPRKNSTDINGNDIRPDQAEKKNLSMTQPVQETAGYYSDPLAFYLKAGTHTITLTSTKEYMAIESFAFGYKKDAISYDEYSAKYAGQPVITGDPIDVQAEKPLQKSSRSNYPITDRTSAATVPQDVYTFKLNTLGGQKWQEAGSWVDWSLTVQETGMYKIAMRYRQNIYSGAQSYRKLLINGELPFEEASDIAFNYNTAWQCETVGKGSGDERVEFLFYFEKGREYTIRLQTVLGDIGPILRRARQVVNSLNADYLKILMITGPSPEKNREYYFTKKIPEVLADFKVQADELGRLSEMMVALSAEKGERVAQLDKLKMILDKIVAKPRELASWFTMFKDNVAGLSSWVLSSAYQPLELDYMMFIPSGTEMPDTETGFFAGVWYSIESFIASFQIDYQSIGTTMEHVETDKSVTVWIPTGRDQANILRQLIDTSFTPVYNIAVNLQLVTGGAILPSVLAGQGPDVVVSAGGGDPINYAVRNAVVEIGGMPGFEDIVADRFYESAMTPYRFNGGAYALPENQSFWMMFYRTDVFDQLKIKPPETWTEMEQVTKELKNKNMSIGLPHDLNALLMMMYQRGAALYRDNGASTNLDSQEAVLAFSQLTDYFTLQKLPAEYDFANRFRSGEMPLALADYTMYNQMSLFAPEIRGKWGMTSVPGTVQEDGTISHASASGGSAVMMMRGVKDELASWEFMKWWTSDEVQASFGTEMETVMNDAARQPTANRNALAMMSWSKADYDSIVTQWEDIVGTPEVPGGYYTSRVMTFAFNRVKDQNVDPGDALQFYVDALNSELSRKRAEFGL